MKPTINQQKNFWASMNPVLLQYTNAAYSEVFWTPERCALQHVRRTCKSLMEPLAHWERAPVEGWLRGALSYDGATQAEAQAVVDHVREAVRAVEGTRPPWQPYRALWASRPACEHRGLEAFVHARRLDGLPEGRITQAAHVEVAWRDALDECRKRWAFAPPDLRAAYEDELKLCRADGLSVRQAVAELTLALMRNHPERFSDREQMIALAVLRPHRFAAKALPRKERKAARQFRGTGALV